MDDPVVGKREQAASRWAAMEADCTEEERAAARSRTMAEGLQNAIGLWALTVAELSRRCTNQEELVALLQGEPPFDLTAQWRANHSE